MKINTEVKSIAMQIEQSANKNTLTTDFLKSQAKRLVDIADKMQLQNSDIIQFLKSEVSLADITEAQVAQINEVIEKEDFYVYLTSDKQEVLDLLEESVPLSFLLKFINNKATIDFSLDWCPSKQHFDKMTTAKQQKYLADVRTAEAKLNEMQQFMKICIVDI